MGAVATGGHVPTPEPPLAHRAEGAPAVSSTKDKLIHSARELFERDGFRETSVGDITEHAGVARGTFYVYFNDKTDIFKAVLLEADLRLSDEILTIPGDISGDLRAALYYSNKRFFEMFRTLSPLYRAIAEAINFDAEVRAIRVAQREGHIDHVAKTLEDWQRRGLADPRIDARHTAAALVCMLAEFAYLAFGLDQPYEIEKMADTVTDAWMRSVGFSGSKGAR
jgi:AcrR family transcriptional regulator